MRHAMLVGLAVAAVLVGANAALAASTVGVRTHAQATGLRRAGSGNVVAMRGGISVPHAYIAEKGGKGAIYVSDYGASVLYGYGPKGGSPVFTTSNGLSGPQGIAVTKTQVYVANTNLSQILMFAPPNPKATHTIVDSGEYPAGVAVYKGGSAIWVSNICNTRQCGNGNLEEYSSSGTLLQTINCGNLYRYYFVAVDREGNVAVDGTDISFNPEVDYITAGTTTCNPISISLAFPGGLAFDDMGNLGVDDQDAQTITTYAPPGYTTEVASASLTGIDDPVGFAFNRRTTGVWTANAGSANATSFAFPAGGNPILNISGLTEPSGVAVLPLERPGN